MVDVCHLRGFVLWSVTSAICNQTVTAHLIGSPKLWASTASQNVSALFIGFVASIEMHLRMTRRRLLLSARRVLSKGLPADVDERPVVYVVPV